MEYLKERPIVAYLVIALVMMLVGYLLRRNVIGGGELLSQALVVLSCLLLLWIASVTMVASAWIVSVVFMVLTLCGCVGLFMGWLKASFTFGGLVGEESEMVPQMRQDGEMVGVHPDDMGPHGGMGPSGDGR